MALSDMATASAAQSMAMLSNADVVWGAYSCRAILNAPGQDIFDGVAISDAPVLEYVTADLPGLVAGQSITVNGASYTTQAPRPVYDGLMSIVGLNS